MKRAAQTVALFFWIETLLEPALVLLPVVRIDEFAVTGSQASETNTLLHESGIFGGCQDIAIVQLRAVDGPAQLFDTPVCQLQGSEPHSLFFLVPYLGAVFGEDFQHVIDLGLRKIAT